MKEFLLHGEELDQFKQENIDMIDDRIKKLAEEFSSDPEDLIGLVLQYRVDMSGK